VAEPFRRYLARTADTDEEEEFDQLRSLRLPDGRNALMDLLFIAKLFKPMHFLEPIFGLRRACVMALISVGVALKLQQLVRSRSSDLARIERRWPKLLLCEVMVQFRICPNHYTV
jgi:hypothetical protein